MLSKRKIISNKIKLRTASSTQRGVGIGVILLIVSLLMAIGIAASKFSGDVPGGDKQRVKLDSAALIQQSAQLRNGLALLSASTDMAWTGAGSVHGRLVIHNDSLFHADSSTFPVGPIGTNSSPILWQLGSYATAANRLPTVYAWTSDTVSDAVCAAINSGLEGGVGTPAVIVLTGLGSGSGFVGGAKSTTGVSLTITNTYTLSADLADILATALGARSTVCLDSGGGSYRVLVRLNN